MERDPYDILQVSRRAEPEVIDAAYRRLARKYHPDVDKSADATERMRDINWAYETLIDATRRADYDRRTRASGPRGTAHRADPSPGAPREKWRPRALHFAVVLLVVVPLAGVLLTRLQTGSSVRFAVALTATTLPTQVPERQVAPQIPAIVPSVAASPRPAQPASATTSPILAPWRIVELSQPNGVQIALETGAQSYPLARKDVRQQFDFDRWELAHEVDLDGDGSREAVVLHFTGGAHCCFEYYVFGLDSGTINMLDGFSLADATIEAVKDLDGDRIPEIVTGDARLGYWGDLSFADSPFLPLVLCRSASRAYYDCTPSFPDYLRSSAREFESQLTTALNARPISRNAEGEKNRAALGMLVSYLRMGMIEEGWSRVRSRCVACETWLRRFPSDIDRALRFVQPDRQQLSLPLASL